MACTVYAVFAPQSVPVGMFTFAAATAAEASSIPMPRYASARGSTWTRTAYFCAPYTSTCATPETVEMRCAMIVSAYSSSVERASVGVVSAM